ncbi:MAG: UDP-2,3-diacylglucosamine diphosphatase, partial [Chthoniobacteraceae bacterium]
THEFDTLYVVGDLIDVWSLRRGIFWPQSHNDVIQKILRAGRKGTRVIYIPGNHDEFIAGFYGHYGAVEVMPRAVHTTADGRRLLIVHGHELDTVVQNARWLAFIGDVGYQFLLHLNAPLNCIRRWLGLPFWSLSAAVKKGVKGAVNFIGAFENGLVQMARDANTDGVVCGHIHTPVIRRIEGMEYFNSGDWVESNSALVEYMDGRIELITDFAAGAVATPIEREEIDSCPSELTPHG